jgi:archaellum biogenesis ATPase FlaH
MANYDKPDLSMATDDVRGHSLHRVQSYISAESIDSPDYLAHIMSGGKHISLSGRFEDTGICTLGELLDNPATEIPQLIAPLLPRKGIAMLAGSSDTGKSSFLRQLALAIALNKPAFLDFAIQAVHHNAICVSTEDNDEAIGPLLKKQLAGQTIPEQARNRLRFVFNTDFLLTRLDLMLTQSPADLVIVDALGDIYDGSLNQSNEVRRFIADYSKLASKYGCLILFMHHTGKRTENLKPSKNNLLGSQGLEAKMRIVLELRLDANNPQLRHLCILKGNYLPQELKSKSYLLHFDENLVFHNTNELIPLGELAKKQEDNLDDSELWEKAKLLLEEGHSYEQTAAMLRPIAEQMHLKPLSKSTLGRRLPKAILNLGKSASIQLETEPLRPESNISPAPFLFTNEQVKGLFPYGAITTREALIVELFVQYKSKGEPEDLFAQLQQQGLIVQPFSGIDEWRIKTFSR